MSKALVIKGADFSTNKVTTVTLDETVPCTGITLSESSISMTAVGSNYTLTATVAPVETTDEILWQSSNENIVKVQNGVLLQTGVGTAIITARCGVYQATCTVTAIMVYAESDLLRVDDASIVQRNNVMIYTEEQARYMSMVLNWNATNGYQILSNPQSYQNTAYAIPIPRNASSCNVVFPTDIISQVLIYYINTKQKQTVVSDVDAATYLDLLNVTQLTGQTDYTFDLTNAPSSADGCVITLGGPFGSSSSTFVTTPIVITFE